MGLMTLDPSSSLERPPSRALLATIKDHALLLFTLLGLMWALEILDLLPFIRLDAYGIHPRSMAGLFGILFAPFLHVGFGHLLANSAPFLVLGGIVLLGGSRLFWRVTIFVVLLGGAGVWLIGGRYTTHLGASGLVFGYLGFLLARGYVERSITWVLIGVAILIVYGGLLISVLPIYAGVSWESHLFGFLAGIASARLFLSSQRHLLE